MDFEIESGIPVPKRTRQGRNKYPLEKLDVGQSFFIPLDDESKPTAAKNLRSSMAVRAKKLDIKIVTIGDNTGVRVWRTQ